MSATHEPFLWGVATSAYQIEGARGVDGKSDSIWDTFSDAGRMAMAGDQACDHYHRLEEDLDLLATLEVSSYRFSIAWTRVLPNGVGEPNPAGIDFYRRLVTGLRERGIEPMPTLYHWDLPQVLQDRGGWANRNTAEAFAEYAGTMADALPDVGRWLTQNEPWVTAYLGHLYGVFAPGLTDWPTALKAAHHLLLSHGLAMDRIRDVDPDAKVGIALDCRPTRNEPGSATAKVFDGFRNRWFFDPVFGRGYPDDIWQRYLALDRIDPGDPFVMDDDMDVIGGDIDFLGLNYYTTVDVQPGSEELDDPEGPVGVPPDAGHTEMGWLVDGDGLEAYLTHIADEYAPTSIVVSENGASYSDAPDELGVITDTRRIAYLDSHISAVRSARQRGVPVDGYFVWSLMDNLEWTQGFNQRFGLVWVDTATYQRTPKASFDWYRRVVSSGFGGEIVP